ncbi:dUTP diphosphatase [Candidatus Berkelbacteria bacterium]|nr:dUTP diphosphatase [Candidatus Berkelbacteria bacterium]
MDVQIHRINSDANIPKYQTEGAACFDLEVIEDVTIEPSSIAYLPTGLVFVIPKGYYMAVVPRSSTPKTGLSIANSPGTVDSDYCGATDEVKIIVQNNTNKPVKVEKYQRIAQAMILPVPKIKFVEISKDKLSSKSRGGFGSTGANSPVDTP